MITLKICSRNYLLSIVTGLDLLANENYYVEQVRTENMKRALSISGAMIWNSIPLSIKTL